MQEGKYLFDPAHPEAHVGTHRYDLVHAIGAAVDVLTDKEPAPPFCLTGLGPDKKKVALLLLAHFVGDLHQPLHVGAVYLKANMPYDPAAPAPQDSKTVGGNSLCVQGVTKDACQSSRNLHAEWDKIRTSLAGSGDAITNDPNTKYPDPPPDVPMQGWAAVWASETVGNAVSAYGGLTYSGMPDPKNPGKYLAGDWYFSGGMTSDQRDALQKKEITEAGARLAQLLTAIWPDSPAH